MSLFHLKDRVTSIQLRNYGRDNMFSHQAVKRIVEGLYNQGVLNHEEVTYSAFTETYTIIGSGVDKVIQGLVNEIS